MELSWQTHQSISEIDRSAWNAICGDQPFLRHEFLRALEETGCATSESGWAPQHVTVTDRGGA